MELRAENISKIIHKKTILSNVNLELHNGTVYGFVGANGSGKTMLFRALSGLMSVTSGRITWNGKVLHRDFSVLPSLGILLENVRLYSNMTGMDNLRYLASINRKIGDDEIRYALKRVELNPDDRRIYQKYSLGMKQKLGIAAAIMEKPELIILDEPSNALDEKSEEILWQIVSEEKERGALILISCHTTETLEKVSDEIFRMDMGQIKEHMTV